MSFIFDDKKLIEQLIKAGEKSIQKKAQEKPQPSSSMMGEPEFNKMVSDIHQQTFQSQMENPEIPQDVVDTYNLAKKLVLGLRSAIITDPRDPQFVKRQAPVGYRSAEAPELKPENAKTLGDFLTWCAQNGVTWDNKDVVWNPSFQSQAQAQPTPQQTRAPAGYWTFQSYERDKPTGATVRDPDTRQGVTKEYYADKESLIQLLTYLRDSEEAKGNEVLRVMLGNIIKEANKFLQPNEQIGPRPAAQPTAQFKDTDVVDGFNSSILDPKNAYDGIQQWSPGFDRAPQKLTYGDIKDFGSLQAWLGGMTGPDKKNPNDPDGNPCPLIHILYLRAKYLAGRADLDRLRPKYSELAKTYLQNITNFGRQFQFGGKPCAVTSEGTSDQPVPGKPGAPGAGAGKVDPNILRQLAAMKIFDVGVINLVTIRTWTKMFADMTAGTEQGGSAATIFNAIQTEMGALQQHVPMPDMPIQTNWLQSVDRIQSWATGHNPLLAIETLTEIINYAGSAYRLFVEVGPGGYGDQIKQYLGPAVYSECLNQVAGSGSPWAANVGQLMAAKRMYSAYMREQLRSK